MLLIVVVIIYKIILPQTRIASSQITLIILLQVILTTAVFIYRRTGVLFHQESRRLLEIRVSSRGIYSCSRTGIIRYLFYSILLHIKICRTYIISSLEWTYLGIQFFISAEGSLNLFNIESRTCCR